ncbi:hypothetical protein [Bythopirellula polymerisocia]|uniref:Uncharacterized protein n=1 Tax=Bythopirellula polymerisocia TaxID=2528003 RepID=A0A5C6CYQ0_9BACT|nr:hypothetical protein [Bythopirellula polymerisocia]TWU30063.1 hypothetical protein Pla144_08490 [Bythopirellula polymerisocia]
MTNTNLRWKADLSASSLYAVLSAVKGLPAVNNSLAEILQEPGDCLVESIKDCGLEVTKILEMLVCLAPEYENNRQLSEIVLSRIYGQTAATEQRLSVLSAAISGLETRALAERPELVDELALRARPLHEQWEARGPGLLRQLARSTEESFVAETAEVVLVAPFVGGYGCAYPRFNRVVIEGVLTNPHLDLPEALRLGWLLAQLQVDAPIYADAVAGDRLDRLAQLATIPAVLAAAEGVEWATCDVTTVQRALECWCLERDNQSELAKMLLQWWETYDQGTSSWQIAWRALDALIPANAS